MVVLSSFKKLSNFFLVQNKSNNFSDKTSHKVDSFACFLCLIEDVELIPSCLQLDLCLGQQIALYSTALEPSPLQSIGSISM
uniref:Uncharacterized protein n=1 Tax=Solanum lycopersicum TaxID=4081 RepID=A0A3Q7FJT4_SOLLC